MFDLSDEVVVCLIARNMVTLKFVEEHQHIMANLALVLKDEIRRLARKEVRSQINSTAKAISRYRHDIATLKKQLQAQDKKIASLENGGRKSAAATDVDESDELDGIRFSARSVRAQRTRLGLSANDYSKLIGVTPLTIYNWESGKSRPRAAQLANLVAVRGIGKREALAKLEEMGTPKSKRGRRPAAK